MKIAIIGSGISGLSTALLLSQKHDITIFEIDKRFGGHSNTVEVKNKNTNSSISHLQAPQYELVRAHKNPD